MSHNPRINAVFSTPGGPYSIKTEGKTLTKSTKYIKVNGKDVTRDGEEAPHKHLLEAESHSKLTLKLIKRDPSLANMLREKLSGALMNFASGTFHDDFTQDMSRSFVALSRDMFHAIRKDGGSLLTDYSHLFTNFVCMVGNIGFCGSVPSFRFKVKFVETGQTVWLSLFYTPTESEDEMINNFETAIQLEATREGLGKQRTTVNRAGPKAVGKTAPKPFVSAVEARMAARVKPSARSLTDPSNLDVGLGGEAQRAATQHEIINRSTHSEGAVVSPMTSPGGPYSIKQEGKTLTHNRKWDENPDGTPHRHLLEAESHSKMTMKLIKRDPGLADILREKLSGALETFSKGTYEDDLTKDMSRSYVALSKEMFHAIRKDENGKLANYGHLFTNFMCTVGNMGYCGSIPCFRFKVKFVKTGQKVWLSLFYTMTEQEDMMVANVETRGQLEVTREGLAKERKTVNRLGRSESAREVRASQLSSREVAQEGPKRSGSRARKQAEAQLDLLYLQQENARLVGELEGMRKGRPLSRSNSARSLRESSSGRDGSQQNSPGHIKANHQPQSALQLCLKERERAETKLNQKLVLLAMYEAKEQGQAETNQVLFSQLEASEAQVLALRAECQCERTAARAATLEAEAVKAGASASLAWAEECVANSAGDTPLLRTQLDNLQRCAAECESRSREIQAMSMIPSTGPRDSGERAGAFDPTNWAKKKKEAIMHAENLRAAKKRAFAPDLGPPRGRSAREADFNASLTDDADTSDNQA